MVEEKKTLFIIFGGSGDLAHRKLYPALFQLYLKGYLAQHFAVIGTARRPWSDDYFRETILANLKGGDQEQQQAFAQHFYYQSHDVQDADHYIILKKLIDKLDQKYQLQGNRLFYMAMAPALFGTIAAHLKSEHLLSEAGYSRLVIEKPFGHDYDSAADLNQAITSTFDRDQVFRIDHYLGKEMMQNIPYLRFTNPILSKVWNRNFIDNVQITLSESLGVEERGGYYEHAGALRDMVQNHIMQIIAMLTFPKPDALCDRDYETAKSAVFDHLQNLSQTDIESQFVRGQYGTSQDGQVKGYRQEDQVDAHSNTETFVAGEIQVNLPDWEGVPFYVRTGKRLAQKQTRIDLVFKKEKSHLFAEPAQPVVFSIVIDPTSTLSLRLNGKTLGQSTDLAVQSLVKKASAREQKQEPDAYERLLLEALLGQQRNFVPWPHMAGAWQFIDKIRAAWAKCDCPDFPNYQAGSMGPEAADELLARSGRTWLYTGK